MQSLYDDKGVKHKYSSFSCPKCRSPWNRVTHTNHDEITGETCRRRKCKDCGHAWYTAQQPEYLIRSRFASANSHLRVIPSRSLVKQVNSCLVGEPARGHMQARAAIREVAAYMKRHNPFEMDDPLECNAWEAAAKLLEQEADRG